MSDRPEAIHPDYIYRTAEARRFCGYGPTQFREKIRTGEVPPGMKLSDSGRARGWLGRGLLGWQAERIAAAERETAGEAASAAVNTDKQLASRRQARKRQARR